MQSLDDCLLPEYTQYIENENESLPAFAIHKHAKNGYSTTRAGAKLVPGITIGFDLSDPFFCEYKPGEYSSLHDPHLKHFLNKQSVRRCLIKNNLINKDGCVRCTLQEFNRFQRNLKHYFKVQKRIAIEYEEKLDAKKMARDMVKQQMLHKRIQHTVKIAEARARHSESTMKRRRQIMDGIVQKDRQMVELIQRIRMEREDKKSYAQLERKRRELFKIRLDSDDLIRRHTIIHRVRHKERINHQKQLLKKQRRVKEHVKKSLNWHAERMCAKEEDAKKKIESKKDRQTKRQLSIAIRTQAAEENRNRSLERQQTESNRHQDIEDDNLKEARRWEKHVETKRANAAHSWRARMHCMQSVAEGRMADIERRLQNRKSDALQRKKLQIEQELNYLEKMDVTVLGTTGYGSYELANIHRDSSKLKFSAYCDPGRNTTDPTRTTQFHAYFKPLQVMQAKVIPGMSAPSSSKHRLSKHKVETVHSIPIAMEQLDSTECVMRDLVGDIATQSVPDPFCNITDDIFKDIMEDVIRNELTAVMGEAEEDIANEPYLDMMNEIMGEVMGEILMEDCEPLLASYGVVNEAIETAEVIVGLIKDTELGDSRSAQNIIQMESNFTMESDEHYHLITEDALTYEDLIQDVVTKIMACFNGQHLESYSGQSSLYATTSMDGEEIITQIITRLVGTLAGLQFSNMTGLTARESAESILSCEDSPSRALLKDLHKRAQFLLNHALDVAKVKLKMKGYNYLTWNILEDALNKAKETILIDYEERIVDFTDSEVVDIILERAQKFLLKATTLLYEMMNVNQDVNYPTCSSENIVEVCYQEQLQKIENDESDLSLSQDCNLAESPSIVALQEYVDSGDLSGYAEAIVQRSLRKASAGMKRQSSLLLTHAGEKGNLDIAGNILTNRALSSAKQELADSLHNKSSIDLKKAMRLGDVEVAGKILAGRALQRAVSLSVTPPIEEETDNYDIPAIEQKLDTSILDHALVKGDLETAGNIIAELAFKDALSFLQYTDSVEGSSNTVSINQADELKTALEQGNLEKAGFIMVDMAFEDGIRELEVLDFQVDVRNDVLRHESSIVLENALMTGELDVAGDVIAGRALRSGLNTPPTAAVRRDSSIVLEKALERGDLNIAGDIIANRIFKDVLNPLNTPNSSPSSLEKVKITSNLLRRQSSLDIEGALKAGDLPEASILIAERAVRSGVQSVSPDPTRINSTEALKTALEEGDLPTASEVIVEKLLRSAQGENPSNGLRRESSMLLDNELIKGNPSLAGDMILGKALRDDLNSISPVDIDEQQSAPFEVLHGSEVEKSTSCLLKEALSSKDEALASTIITDRAIRSALITLEDHVSVPISKSFRMISHLEAGKLDEESQTFLSRVMALAVEHLEDQNKCGLEEALGEGRAEDASEMLTDALLSCTVESASKIYNEIYTTENGDQGDHPDIEMTGVILAKNILKLAVEQITQDQSDHPGSSNDIVSNDKLVECAGMIVGNILQKAADVLTKTNVIEQAIVNINDGKKLARAVSKTSSEKLNAAVEACDPEIASHLMITSAIKNASKIVQSVDFTAIQSFKSMSDILAEDEGLSAPRKSIGKSYFDKLKNKKADTVESTVDMKSSSVASNLSKKRASRKKICEERLPVPTPSADDLNKKDETGYEPVREMLMAEEREARLANIISKRSVLSDKSQRESQSSSDLKSNKSSLPYIASKQRSASTISSKKSAPSLMNSTKSAGFVSKARTGSNSSVRSEAQMSQHSLKDVKSSSEKQGEVPTEGIEQEELLFVQSDATQDLPNELDREVGDILSILSSDEIVDDELEGSGSAHHINYVRKIHSKGHVYYIDTDGVIKKKTRRKRSNKKMRQISKDDMSGDLERNPTEDDAEPHAVSSESSLIQSDVQPYPPSSPPSESSKRSLERRRSSFKRKDSNLQMLAVINSSYTNMMGKNDSKKDLEQEKRKSIEDLLTETDKELIRRLSEEHAAKIDEIIEGGNLKSEDQPLSPSDSGVETVHVVSAETLTSQENLDSVAGDPSIGGLQEKENTGHSSGYSSNRNSSES